jgi:hypothetical protein
MVPMRCRTALAVVLTASSLAMVACRDAPPMPTTCTDTDQAGYLRALRAAPGPVRLPGGVAISECTRRVLSDADLENLGTVVHGAAETLSARAGDGDTTAALQLGYLSAAVDRGSGSTGIAAELARRVQTALTVVGARAARQALRRGADAGAANG